MKTCPACRKSIDTRAIRCAYCHTDFTAQQMEDGRRESGKSRFREVAGYVIGTVMVVYAAIYWLGENAENLGKMSAEVEQAEP